MGGISPRNDNHAVAVVEELCEHLRAVLRDALCGHLEADLCSLADDLLAEASARGRPRGTRPPLAERAEADSTPAAGGDADWVEGGLGPILTSVARADHVERLRGAARRRGAVPCVTDRSLLGPPETVSRECSARQA